MNGKRDKNQGPRNPWVRKTDAEEEADNPTPEPDLPPSPWSLEVPARPPSPWDTPDAGTTPGAGSPGDKADPAPGTAGSAPSTWGSAGAAAGGPAAGGAGVQGAGEAGAPWGERVGPPSLRRPEPVKKKGFKLPPVVIPIVAGLAVVVLVAVALTLLTGGDDKADPGPVQSLTPTPSYTPPANALPVQFGVSLVPAPGWTLLAKETNGKQVINYGANGAPRAYYWVRQKQNVTANAFALGIVEGATKDRIAQLGNMRNLECPKDVLVECVALSYTLTPSPGATIKGDVEVYRRKDGVVTALDYQVTPDFAATADAAVATMKQSVIASL
ncbi:hypothetical protein [Streptomyces sp. SID13031]|uniref:hypothetical protein n=1 Tax=Streptomyces sp. SID13031 TaxID=2706046 RepID=UPI0013C87357|nr:hypothetical protein [Streptomyces sp. SID13031]NEA32984.1 hypothetical protein [Streptomyces sp. SID13031]